MQDIYQIIHSIDSYIKKNRLYLVKEIHGKGKFDFQDICSAQYDSFTPYCINSNLMTSIFDKLDVSYSDNTAYNGCDISINSKQYHLLSNYGAEDDFYTNFLHEGIYLVNGFISNSGDIVIATYSKNFAPRIYEGNVNVQSIEGKNTATLKDLLSFKRPYYFKTNDLTSGTALFSFKTEHKKALDVFVKLNKEEKINKPKEKFDFFTLTKKLNTKNDFSWENIFKSIDKISGEYFNDTDSNILNRADMVNYLTRHCHSITNEFKSLNADDKFKILNVFDEKKEFITLISQAIDLRQNNYYKDFMIEKGYPKDYGASTIVSLCNFIQLQLSLREKTYTNKKVKI